MRRTELGQVKAEAKGASRCAMTGEGVGMGELRGREWLTSQRRPCPPFLLPNMAKVELLLRTANSLGRLKHLRLLKLRLPSSAGPAS